MTTFTAGHTYTTRSIGDANCIITVRVADRTAKTILTTEGKKLRISSYDGVEFVRPWGNYSMAPIVRAA